MPHEWVRGSRSCSLPLVNTMTLREIYETAFDEDVQPDSSASSCPKCNGRVTTNVVETMCEDCGYLVETQHNQMRRRVNYA